MSRSDRETLPDVQEALPDVQECSEGPPRCPGVVKRPFRMSGSSREALPDVREWSGGPAKCPGMVGKPSWMFGSGREASRMSGTGREALPNVQKWWEALPDVRELSGVPFGSLGGHPGVLRKIGTPSWMSLRGGKPLRLSGSCRVALPDVREGHAQRMRSGRPVDVRE